MFSSVTNGRVRLFCCRTASANARPFCQDPSGARGTKHYVRRLTIGEGLNPWNSHTDPADVRQYGSTLSLLTGTENVTARKQCLRLSSVVASDSELDVLWSGEPTLDRV